MSFFGFHIQSAVSIADVSPVMEAKTSASATVLKANASALVVAQASDQITIDSSKLTAIWLLLAVLGIVLAWALHDLRRRRRMALRLDRLGAFPTAAKYPAATTHSKEDFEALLDIVALDERLPELVAEAEHASHEVTDRVEQHADEELDSGFPRS